MFERKVVLLFLLAIVTVPVSLRHVSKRELHLSSKEDFKPEKNDSLHRYDGEQQDVENNQKSESEDVHLDPYMNSKDKYENNKNKPYQGPYTNTEQIRNHTQERQHRNGTNIDPYKNTTQKNIYRNDKYDKSYMNTNNDYMNKTNAEGNSYKTPKRKDIQRSYTSDSFKNTSDLTLYNALNYTSDPALHKTFINTTDHTLYNALNYTSDPNLFETSNTTSDSTLHVTFDYTLHPIIYDTFNDTSNPTLVDNLRDSSNNTFKYEIDDIFSDEQEIWLNDNFTGSDEDFYDDDDDDDDNYYSYYQDTGSLNSNDSVEYYYFTFYYEIVGYPYNDDNDKDDYYYNDKDDYYTPYYQEEPTTWVYDNNDYFLYDENETYGLFYNTRTLIKPWLWIFFWVCFLTSLTVSIAYVCCYRKHNAKTNVFYIQPCEYQKL